MTNRRLDLSQFPTRLVGWSLSAVVGLGVLASAGPATADATTAAAPAVQKTLCVFDPGGQNGDLFAKMQDYKVSAVAWGVDFTLKPYTDESVAAADFRNKVCDAVLLTGLTGKQFNQKTYTIEAMGLLDDYPALERMVKLFANPRAAPLNRSGEFETAGIYPAGAVYLYLRDRQDASLPRLTGRKIAWIGADPAARQMIDKVGAAGKQAEVSTFASMFNNGSVDVCYGPATAYAPLELQRGVGKSGGVVRFPLAQLTFQVYIRGDAFPAGFAQSSREYVYQQFASMIAMVTKAEGSVKSWVEVTPDDRQRYSDLLAGVRDSLVTSGVYEPSIIKLAKK